MILATLDVSSLYTNIPQGKGIEAVRRMIRLHSTQVVGEPHTNTLSALLKMVLEMNNFEFNGQQFLQIAGTAMQSLLPTYSWPNLRN